MKYVLLTIIIGLSLVLAARSQDRGVRAQASSPGRRIALIIGNSAYRDSPLRNTLNDAEDVARALRNLGFEVIQKKNLKLGEMRDAINEFGRKLRAGSVGLFYFAGHGVQVSGENYLIPTDAEMSSEDKIQAQALGLGFVTSEMAEAGSETNIIILDACRSVPVARRFRSPDRGLAHVVAGKGMLIAYATAPGSVAGDGDERNGVYTQELLRNIRTPGIAIEELLRRVRVGVYARTEGRQIPWESSSLFREFHFIEGAAVLPPGPRHTNPPEGREAPPGVRPTGAAHAGPSLTASVEGIEFSLAQCAYSKPSLTAECVVELKNKGRRREVLVHAYSKEFRETVLTDAYGNQYNPTNVRHGENNSSSSINFTLESGVPYQIQLLFRVGPGFGLAPTFSSLTVAWSIGEPGTSIFFWQPPIKFESGPIVSKQEPAAPPVNPQSEVKQSSPAPPLVPIPSGPNSLAPTYAYLINGGATRLALKAEPVTTNNDQALAQLATRLTNDLGAQGSHVWDNQWYYRRLKPNEHLLVVWGTNAALGWILVQKTGNAWWYKTNSGQWRQINVGESKEETWTVTGTKISISIEIPRQKNGWTPSDVKYKFGT